MHERLGRKAEGLVALREGGFRVPDFLVFPASSEVEAVEREVALKFGIDAKLSVRSSSMLEDGDAQSYAGAFRSEVGVNYNAFRIAWGQVKASLPDPASDHIIVQKMVFGTFSGVAFADHTRRRVMISYLPGLCKAVVEGFDAYQMDYYEGEVRITSSPDRIVGLYFDENDNILNEETSELQMSSESITELIQTALEISNSFERGQDIEWTLDDGVFYWLQSRPITADPWGSERVQIFDSANVGESFGGVVSPLTISFARKLYSQVYQDLLLHSGVSKMEVANHKQVFDQLVDGAYGRMYYRMDNWYRFMMMLPGYARNKRNLEKMLMLNPEDVEGLNIKPSIGVKVSYYFRVVWKLGRFRKTMLRFETDLIKVLDEAKTWSIHEMSAEEVRSKMDGLFEGILRRWYLTVENDTVVMSTLAMLTRNDEKREGLYDFHSVSTDQVASLVALSKVLLEAPELRNAIDAEDEEMWKGALAQNPIISAQYETYLHRFGGRFANELKLETPDITDSFASFARLIKLYAGHDVHRNTAEKPQYPWLMRVFHRFAERREVFRLYRASMFALMRKLVMRLAALGVNSGDLQISSDIFYLDWNDLTTVGSGDASVEKKIQAEKDNERFYGLVKPPEFFKVKEGRWPSLLKEEEHGSMMKGIGASSGLAHGKAEVMRTFSVPEDKDIGILVTERTDPGWTALMAVSKGLVVEHGGMLSHASIVARELQIPAVIGLKGACDRIVSGEMISVDGTAGTVIKTNDMTNDG